MTFLHLGSNAPLKIQLLLAKFRKRAAYYFIEKSQNDLLPQKHTCEKASSQNKLYFVVIGIASSNVICTQTPCKRPRSFLSRRFRFKRKKCTCKDWNVARKKSQGSFYFVEQIQFALSVLNYTLILSECPHLL